MQAPRFSFSLSSSIICAVGRSAVVIMICCLKDIARKQRERERERARARETKEKKEEEIVERREKRKVCLCSYPRKNYNRRTSKMSFSSTAHTLGLVCPSVEIVFLWLPLSPREKVTQTKENNNSRFACLVEFLFLRIFIRSRHYR